MLDYSQNNQMKLLQDLQDIGLPVLSIYDDIEVKYSRGLTKQEKIAAQNIIDNHDIIPEVVPTYEDHIKLLEQRITVLELDIETLKARQ